MNELKLEPEKLKENGDSVWRPVQVEPTILDESERLVRGMITTDAIDGYNTIVDPDGARVQGYMNYASVLFNHDSGSLIGNAEEVRQLSNGLESKWKFLPEGTSELADEVWELYKGGWLNGYSIGFVPLEWEEEVVEGRGGEELEVIRFTEWEMKEYSITSVPANAEAMARNQEVKSMFNRVNQRGVSSYFLIGDPMKDRDQTKEQDLLQERTVPVYQDHPIASVDSWDESKSRDQIAKYAGGPDKEDIDWNEYKKGFFYYNGDDPENKGSYKLPYCYVIDGQLKAADEGIYAVAQYIGQTDMPSDEKDKVKNQLEKYYGKMDETAPWNEDSIEDILEEEKSMDELAEKIAEKLMDKMEEEEVQDDGGDLEEKIKGVVEDEVAEAKSDAEDAWAKADRLEDEVEELSNTVEDVRSATETIIDFLKEQ